MIILRKYPEEQKEFNILSEILVPYFEPGITEAGRRYVILVTNDGKKKR